MLDPSNIRFVLVNTTHPGNIGSAARAIKNMGFSNLYLVAPAHFPDAKAIARASGAKDVLENAIILPTIQEATADCHLVFGTSSRERSLPIPLITARDSAREAYPFLNKGYKVAILFGQERIGLTNDELSLCHFHVYIPCNPNFASLNVASAVQILAYEFHLELATSKANIEIAEMQLATTLQVEQFYKHLETTLIALKFLDPLNPRQMMKKLRRLFGRTQLEQNELNILRGILTAINRSDSA